MRRIWTALIAVVMLVAVACGDDTADGVNTAQPTAATSSDTDTATTVAPASDTGDDDGGTDDGAMGGGSYADLTINGSSVRFAASDVGYSHIEGVEDVTLEKCDPSFFGAGFWVIGYPIDDNGELVVKDEFGNLGGILTAVLPFEDTAPDMMEFEFDLDYEPLGVDARYRPDAGSTFSYEVNGSNASGMVSLDNVGGELIDVAFDIVCAA